MPASAESAARTREKIHAAAVRLFTRQGYHGTGMREIAREAGVSLGNAYNHHRTKLELFEAILADYEARYTAPDTPLARALNTFEGLEDLERLGEAARQTVRRFEDYIRLIYVDVVELEGEHIRRLFGGMRRRYEEALGPRLRALQAAGELAPDVDPIAGLMTATISYFYLFNIERIFGVRRLYGCSDKQAIADIAALLRRGLEPR
ncbi:MAG: TetR/AcrR family transcriptional regulator [Planctomycetota bacterium]|nr:MAG: TetR/AcrR family transcriptional regulator [Planctomycetota bacterium]